MRRRAVLPQINPLPRAQPQATFRDRNRQASLGQHRTHVGGHVVGAFGDVAKQGVAVGNNARNQALKIPMNLRVGVFRDNQRGAGMVDEQVAHPGAAFGDARLYAVGQLVKPPPLCPALDKVLLYHRQNSAKYGNPTIIIALAMETIDDASPLKRRRRSTAVRVGEVTIGGDSPIVVQAMIDVATCKITEATSQITALARAGAEIVRVTVNDKAAARATPKIVERLAMLGTPVPLVGDFHFNGYTLLERYPECAEALDKLRVNPGNVGRGELHDPHFARMIECACRFDKPVRIGVNWGSLDQDLLARRLDENAARPKPKPLAQITREVLVESALTSAALAEKIGLAHDRIVVSCKLSNVGGLVQVYRRLAAECDYPLHLGLTEAGMGRKGTVSSTSALAILLAEGIGDTIRISLTPEPGADRSEEVRVAREILQSLELRAFNPDVIACPGCGRTDSAYFRELAKEIRDYLEVRMDEWKRRHPGVENMSVAVMGCVVNGPGESKHANIGISLPGSGEQPVAPVYVDGKKDVTLRGDTIADDFKGLIEAYVAAHY